MNNFFNNNTRLYTKIVIHTLSALIVADIIWLIVMIPSWSHSAADKNEYWGGLAGLHGFTIFLAFVELIVKGLAVLYLAYDFKQKNAEDMGM